MMTERDELIERFRILAHVAYQCSADESRFRSPSMRTHRQEAERSMDSIAVRVMQIDGVEPTAYVQPSQYLWDEAFGPIPS